MMMMMMMIYKDNRIGTSSQVSVPIFYISGSESIGLDNHIDFRISYIFASHRIVFVFAFRTLMRCENEKQKTKKQK